MISISSLKKMLNSTSPETPEPPPIAPKPEVNVSYRAADIHDILPLSLMWVRMTQEIFPDFIEVDKAELDRFAFAMADRLRMQNVFTLVAEVEGKAIGFIHGYLQSRPYGRPDQIAFCECLYIQPDHRGKGMKEALVESFISWAEAQGAAIEFITKYDPDLVPVWGRSGAKPYSIIYRR